MITREELVRRFTYDPETGHFFRLSQDKKGRPAKFEGKIAGCLRPNGYRVIGIGGVDYQAAHLVWLWEKGELPMEIDHKDLDPSNNRIDNLRPSTRQQNCLNRGLRIDSQTGFKGVKRCPDGKFMVRIVVEGGRKYLGLYDQAEEAARIYDNAARIHHGEFARLNFPE